jgi:hypothetical protein
MIHCHLDSAALSLSSQIQMQMWTPGAHLSVTNQGKPDEKIRPRTAKRTVAAELANRDCWECSIRKPVRTSGLCY